MNGIRGGQMISKATDADVARIRGGCYRLFSAGYCLPDDVYYEPDDLRQMSESLRSLGSDSADVIGAMADSLAQISADDLRLEYSRLFVGPFSLPAPPYGSVYLEDGRRLMGDSTVDVVRRYREVGIDIDPSQSDVPDHIAIELEFMSCLVHIEEEAASTGDADALKDALQRQESFLEDHLCAWVPQFTAAVTQDSESAFFGQLVTATDIYLKEDLARVRSAQRQE
jgi:putative dimethyl sulfoxide reductase chaperone